MQRPFILLTLLLSCGALAAQTGVPRYRAARTMDPITVDGKLDEFTWAALPRAGRFHNIRDAESRPAATEAALAWDDFHLYVAFACADPIPWSGMYERDSFLWRHEVVEVFLDPDGDGRDYPELEVSPHNVVIDLLIPEPPGPRTDPAVAARWDIEGLRTAASRSHAGWTVEIAIPWESLSEAGVSRPPRPGDRWRAGLYRIERPGGLPRAEREAELQEKLAGADEESAAEIEKQLEALTAEDEFQAWSPTEESFHEPERFGIIEFVLDP